MQSVYLSVLVKKLKIPIHLWDGKFLRTTARWRTRCAVRPTQPWELKRLTQSHHLTHALEMPKSTEKEACGLPYLSIPLEEGYLGFQIRCDQPAGQRFRGPSLRAVHEQRCQKLEKSFADSSSRWRSILLKRTPAPRSRKIVFFPLLLSRYMALMPLRY